MSAVTKKTTEKLFTGDPSSVMVIRKVSPNITTFSVPFARFGLIPFGGRGTLAKMQSGGLAIFSPVQLSPEVKREVDAQGGNVSYIIAPDIEHHLWIGAWKEAYPNARVIAPGGLAEKRSKQGNEDVPIDITFKPSTKRDIELPGDLTQTFDIEFFDGHPSREIVLYHRADKTVIEADLLFNLPSNEQYSKAGGVPGGVISKIFTYFSQTSVEGTKGQQRFIWYAMAKDKKSFGESAKRVAGWDIERIIPCHGDVIENGNEVFKRLFAWHL